MRQACRANKGDHSDIGVGLRDGIGDGMLGELQDMSKHIDSSCIR